MKIDDPMAAGWASSPRLKVAPDTAAAVVRGHPWVLGQLQVPDAGTPLRLVGPDGRLAGYGIADDGPIRVRVLGRGEPPGSDLAALIAERIRRADTFRWQTAPANTDCWRVINGAGDGLPGIVADRYGDLVVLKIYARAWVPWLSVIQQGLQDLGWSTGGLRRLGVRAVDGQEGAEVLWGDVPEQVVVEEHGMRMLVRPWVGQKTGTFLDQREHRRMVGQLSAGRRVVNLFAYNGGFSLAAALGGASRVETVDIAPEAIEDARENFRLNGLDPDQHGFEVADAFAWRPKGRVGLWIVDPPSLARTKQARSAARKAYAKLHRGLHEVLVRDGLLASSSCTAQLDYTMWMDAIRDGLRRGGSWSLLHRSEAPIDHPVALEHVEARYLKFALLRLLD